jgi:hypothetical protein
VDRLHTVRVKRFGRLTRTRAESIVTFEAPYANLVEDGTWKSRPYPFMPQGMRAGSLELYYRATVALDKFVRTIGMGR